MIDHEAWEALDKPKGQLYRQGYILSEPGRTVRVRLTEDAGYLTIKGRTVGLTKPEYEYQIPMQDAEEMLDDLAVSELSKTRYVIPHAGKLWEVDVFMGSNEGLIVAEIELLSEDETFEMPAWVRGEVTGDGRYSNSSLTVRPYCEWESKQ